MILAARRLKKSREEAWKEGYEQGRAEGYEQGRKDEAEARSRSGARPDKPIADIDRD